MYPVSEEYLRKIASRSVVTNWYGKIRTTIGTTYDFNLDTIESGSGRVTRQICKGTDIEIGSTCSAELAVNLYLRDVDRYELYNAKVELFFQLELATNVWETIPVGVFTITEPPERSLDVISIHAYDAMTRFDREYGNLILQGLPYHILSLACQACGVELGSTQEEISNCPNGTVETYTQEEVKIYTYRDLIGFIAAYLCCYAYIGVDGKLYLKQYNMRPVREVPPDWRFTYKPRDYESYYSRIMHYFVVTQETERVILGTDGLTYNLGTNPLIQFNADDVRKAVLTQIITALSGIVYTPFTATVPCDPSLMVGDVLNFTGNHAVDGKLSAITKQVIGINKSMSIECAGSDPNLATMTQKEKQIATAALSSTKDSMYYYDYTNAEEIVIGDGHTEQIILFSYVTTKETHVDFHAAIKLQVDTVETYDNVTDTYVEHDGEIFVTYLQGGEIVTDCYPADSFFDGFHLLNLLYTWWASGNITNTFEVKIQCVGCSVTIEQGEARAYIAGIGLVGDGAWDGSVRVFDTFKPKVFSDIILKQFTDTADPRTITPEAAAFTERAKRKDFSLIMKKFTASPHVQDSRFYNTGYTDSEMSKDSVVTNGGVWENAETGTDGTITTPNIHIERIIRMESEHTANTGDTSYIVSFDNGLTWWTWAEGWHEWDGGYGMVESTMRAIDTASWKAKIWDLGTVRIRAILERDATLADFEIITSDATDWDTAMHLDAVCNEYYVVRSRDRTELRYEYLYHSEEAEIDIGRMSKIDIDTTIYSEILEIEAHARKTGI